MVYYIEFMIRIILLLIVGLFVLTAPLGEVLAQDVAAGIGLRPATVEENMEPGEVRDFVVTVSNLSAEERTYYLFKRNIVGVQAGGVPIFATDGLEPTGYELTEWIALNETELVMAPGEDRQVNFTMAVPEDASPGSHFGAIFVSLDPPRLRQTGAAVGYDVANIITIRVAGEVDESATIRQFSTSNYIYGSTNIEFSARVENTGNTLIRPIGPLEVTNMFGASVAQLTFNESEAGVFPKTVRDFTITWSDEGTGFGRYEAILSAAYGDVGQRRTMSSTVTFWILPMNIIVPAAIILAVILLSTYIGIKLYVRRALSQYTDTRRLVRRRGKKNSSAFLLILVVMLSVTAVFLIILLALFA